MSNLEEEVKQLKEQVKKLQVMLANTGQQVMQLQMHQHKQEIENIGTKTQDLQSMVPSAVPPKSSTRPGDYVTESDLGDMVMELQGQLTLLDQRGIRRILNSRSKDKLLPLPNADGEHHPKFPTTITSLQSLNDQDLFDQWNHFEMLPNGETLEDLMDEANTEEAKEGNRKMMAEIYDSFVQYVGLNPEEVPRKAATITNETK